MCRKDIVIAEHKVRLPDCATVYQAELMAIKQAAELLQGFDDLTTIKIYVDSQAALRTFQMDFIKSKLALQTIEALNLVSHAQMIFVWTKRHVGTHGNEEADKLAKEGTKLDTITDVPVPACSANNLVEQCVNAMLQKEWDRYTEARQTKLFYPKIDKNKAKRVIQWNKLQIGRLIRSVTGHNNLLYHLYNMENHVSPACRFCLDEREEFNHLAFDCPILWKERMTTNAQDPNHSTPDRWTPQQILDFTFFPRINEAFAKPLYILDFHHSAPMTKGNDDSLQVDNPDQNSIDSDTDVSVMDVSSLNDSSSGMDDSSSNISIN